MVILNKTNGLRGLLKKYFSVLRGNFTSTAFKIYSTNTKHVYTIYTTSANAFDAGPTLYKCYTIFLCLLGSCFAYNAMLPLGISERLMDQLETILCLMFSFFFEDSMVSYIKDNVFNPHVTCIASPSDTHYVV